MEIRILREFILRSVGEDLGDGDHSSLACIPWEAVGKAELLIKEEGILAGVDVAKEVFSTLQVASREEMRGKTIVVILPDTGERYLSTDLFD